METDDVSVSADMMFAVSSSISRGIGTGGVRAAKTKKSSSREITDYKKKKKRLETTTPNEHERHIDDYRPRLDMLYLQSDRDKTSGSLRRSSGRSESNHARDGDVEGKADYDDSSSRARDVHIAVDCIYAWIDRAD